MPPTERAFWLLSSITSTKDSRSSLAALASATGTLAIGTFMPSRPQAASPLFSKQALETLPQKEREGGSGLSAYGASRAMLWSLTNAGIRTGHTLARMSDSVASWRRCFGFRKN